jgi:hypothetical protein
MRTLIATVNDPILILPYTFSFFYYFIGSIALRYTNSGSFRQKKELSYDSSFGKNSFGLYHPDGLFLISRSLY